MTNRSTTRVDSMEVHLHPLRLESNRAARTASRGVTQIADSKRMIEIIDVVYTFNRTGLQDHRRRPLLPLLPLARSRLLQ